MYPPTCTGIQTTD